MSKMMFWLNVVVVAIIGIWLFKYLAGVQPSAGLKQFASQI